MLRIVNQLHIKNDGWLLSYNDSQFTLTTHRNFTIQQKFKLFKGVKTPNISGIGRASVSSSNASLW